MAQLEIPKPPTGAKGRERTISPSINPHSPFFSWTRARVLLWSGFIAVAVVAIFMLPLAFPPKIPSQSSSYSVGFSNRVATLATVFLSAIFAIILWSKRLGARITEPEEQAPMPYRWLGWAGLSAIVFTALLGWRVVRSGLYYCDASYFMTQLQWKMHFHGTIYKDFDFAYGPLLLLWPEAFVRTLAHLGMQPMAAYMVSLTVMQVIGIGIVFYILQKLPLTRRLKAFALAGMTFGTLTPLLGLNYTLVRFALPYAALLWIASLSGVWLQTGLFFLAETLMLGVSPELGVAFAGGAGAYGLYRAFTNREFQWLAVCVAPVASFAIAATFLGRSYFEMMIRFAGGAFASVVDPRLHTEIFLTAAVAIAPFAMAGYIRRYGANAGPLVGMYIAALGMLPAGLGHADELHTFFAGVGVLLISLIGISAYRGFWTSVWIGLFLAAGGLSSEGQGFLYLPLEQQVITGNIKPDKVDVARLEAITHGEKIAMPVIFDVRVMNELIRANQFLPSYYCTLINAQDVPGEKQKLREMAQVDYVLVPNQDFSIGMMPDNQRRFSIFRFGYVYKQKREIFRSGKMIEDELAAHWQPVEPFGRFMLFHRK